MDEAGSAIGKASGFRVLAGILAGLASWLIVGTAGLGLLRMTWPDYAVAEPHKTYSVAMLLARLTVGVVCTVAAGGIAAKVATVGSAAWRLGALLLILSTPIHLVSVWADYPAWYHIAYLLPLVPLAGLGGRLAPSGSELRD